jgi:hypothetical protein
MRHSRKIRPAILDFAMRPAGFWSVAIDESVRAFGGDAWLTQINDWIERHRDLTTRELEESPHNQRIRYVHTVRKQASVMTKNGSLVRISPGHFRLPTN